MGKKISFWWDAEKRIQIAKAGEQDSLFYEAYRQALAGVAEIVRASIMQIREYDPFFPQSEYGGQNELRTTCDSQYLYDYPNNIIVFSGERGAGKSSAMLTFVSGLKDKNGLLFKDDFLSKMVTCELPNADSPKVKQMLQTCSFVDLAPIDPTTLEANGQILTVILARMFQLASSIWESGSNRFGMEFSAKQLEEKKQLIQKFSDCYEHIQAIKNSDKPKPEYDGLETLAELGDSSRLKMELYQLVEQLLKFCRPEAGDSSYLVLQIDDTDMNIKKAYDILEDVRRYLVIPRLIIVMAADLKHLTQVVESSLLKDYDNDLEARHEYVEKITHQYITKLFPQTRQIDLPALGTYLREHTESITISYQVPGGTILLDGSKSNFPSLQDQIFRLIYQKTGMVFLKQEHRLHPIIPCNMRLLAHFLSMLVKMKEVDNPDNKEPNFFLRHLGTLNDYEEHANNLSTRLQNIQRFRNYFLTTWINNTLNSKSLQLFRDLEQTDATNRIRYICVRLGGLWETERKKVSQMPGNGSNTASGDNYNASIIGNGQYVDMMRICQNIAEYSGDEDLKRLAFALQTYYSMFAQILAVEDLIDYYDTCAAEKLKKANSDGDEAAQYATEGTGLGCSFSKLHLLFGSQLFPYFLMDTGENAIIELPRSLTGEAESIQLNIAWNVERHDDMASYGDMNVRQCAILLYSMLLSDYSPQDGKASFDLTRPITNCLYLGDNSGLTPCPESLSFATRLNIATIGEEAWRAMRNSSLLTVLNCDVQTKMGIALRRRILAPEGKKAAEDKRDDSLWSAYMKDVYRLMTESLGKSLPIESLKNIDFSKWMDSVAMKSAEQSDDWTKIANNLLAGFIGTQSSNAGGGTGSTSGTLSDSNKESCQSGQLPQAGQPSGDPKLDQSE